MNSQATIAKFINTLSHHLYRKQLTEYLRAPPILTMIFVTVSPIITL